MKIIGNGKHEKGVKNVNKISAKLADTYTDASGVLDALRKHKASVGAQLAENNKLISEIETMNVGLKEMDNDLSVQIANLEKAFRSQN